jgi:hypothetical protein
MNYNEWFEKLATIFVNAGFNIQDIKWNWKKVYLEEVIDPEEAFAEYIENN